MRSLQQGNIFSSLLLLCLGRAERGLKKGKKKEGKTVLDFRFLSQNDPRAGKVLFIDVNAFSNLEV